MSRQDSSEARQALVAKFRSVAAERLQRLNNALLELERKPGAQAAADLIMREIHTLKGEAKLVGFADINLVAHKIEDLLVAASRRGFVFAPGTADLILRGFDVISLLLGKQVGAPPAGADLVGYVAAVDQDLQKAGAVEERPAAVPPPPGAAAAATMRAQTQADSTLRVEAGKIDSLAVQLGDVLRLQRQHEQSIEALSELLDRSYRLGAKPRPEAARGLGEQARGLVAQHRAALLESADRLHELEGMVRELRLLPLHILFERYPRAIRDLAAEQGKKVAVVMRGGDVEVDKQVLDVMAEPCLHLIRNAVDHGIESPPERAATGKPEEATVTLAARQAGTHVEISVHDDGRGLSAERIRRAAVDAHVLSAADAGRLDDKEIVELVFRPGFSTRAEATDMSGRGIGLDVVKQRVESLGGSVRIESAPGRGTAVIADVPISVAMVRVLVVEHGGGCFAFAAASVEVIAELTDEAVLIAGSARALRLDEGQVPLWDLSDILGLPVPESAPDGARAVVLRLGERRLAVCVEHIVGERAIVQRPLDPLVGATPLFIGTGVLDQGRPTLVINVQGFADRAGVSRAGRGRPAPGEAISARGRCILLVEDSELTRDMLADLLAGLGYRVVEATDGQKALAQLEQQQVDLVMTDLEMPVLDGFELIARIRHDPARQDLPIIVLSSCGSAADKERAAGLGADAYLVKSEFREAALAQLVSRFLDEGRAQRRTADRR